MIKLDTINALLSLAIAAFFLSCTNNQNSGLGSNFVENYQVNSVDGSKVIDSTSIKVIRFESNTKSMFGNIDKLYIDDNIFIFDRDYSKSVLVFSIDGNFIRQIGRQGKGPGEYGRLSDMDIDVKNKQIILYDINFRKLMFYTYNGVFLKEIKLKKYCGMTFSIINQSLFVFRIHNSEEFEDELLFVNSSGEVISSSFRRVNKSSFSIIFNPDFFARCDSNLYIIPSYNGRIFQIKKTNVILEKIDLKLDDQMITDRDLDKIEKGDEMFTLKKLTPFLKFHVNSREVFCCRSTYNGEPFYLIGDMKSGKTIGFSRLTGKYDYTNVCSTYRDYFITVRHPVLFKNLFPDAKINDNNCIVLFKTNDINKLDLK